MSTSQIQSHSHLTLIRAELIRVNSTEHPITFPLNAIQWLLLPLTTTQARKREQKKERKRAFLLRDCLSTELGIHSFQLRVRLQNS